MNLHGKKVLLGVSGGIAAYKAAEIVRLLDKQGAVVNVVMTRNATEFITPLTLQTLSRNPVLTDTFDLAAGAEIKHVSLADEADVVILAPATANLIGKLANGIADDLLTSLMLVAKCPVILAPAMNVSMWSHALVQANLGRLREMLRYQIVEPAEGMLACGYEGKGKLADPETIVTTALRALAPADFTGRNVLITAGPTREHFDPVRFLSNPSTGKMGIALAEAAAARGAKVTLVLGPTALGAGSGVNVVRVETADEMYAACVKAFPACDMFIASAAVADFKPETKEIHKVKKGKGDETLTLTRTTDILLELSKQKGDRVIIGFAAETQNMIEHAREKMEKKSCDFIVANDVTAQGSGFGADTNKVTLIGPKDVEELPLLGKREVAGKILDRALAVAQKRGRVESLKRRHA